MGHKVESNDDELLQVAVAIGSVMLVCMVMALAVKQYEGRVTPHLTVSYPKEDAGTLGGMPVIPTDASGPILGFSFQPEYFSPDNDGVNDELIISLTATDESPIVSWSLEIREPQAPYPVFYRIEGTGNPPARTTWNGRSAKGELVQSAMDYPFTFRAEDDKGNVSTLDSKIGVDVLVIPSEDGLKIQVPSIIFRAEEADFIGLPRETVENNNRVLRRIAEILNKFRDYRVRIEGHANRTELSDTEATTEEESELQPLSERRARAVINRLVEFGVSRSRMSAVGMGGTKPIVVYTDRDNVWKNRRVEFILIK
ncbi:MAG: OmpA family protein [Treponema sp.]|jgi:flagellar motor protein MotB|nr:OmpA family protein [Treponema sp.]